MIKGSLLRSVPIVKRFGRKFLSPKMGQKFEVWGFRRGKILTLTMRPPRKSIPTETRHVAQKRCRSMQKCGLQRRARNPIKNKKNPNLTLTFHPFAGPPLLFPYPFASATPSSLLELGPFKAVIRSVSYQCGLKLSPSGNRILIVTL